MLCTKTLPPLSWSARELAVAGSRHGSSAKPLVTEHGNELSLEEALLEELYSFVGEGWEQEDDITLLILRRSASLS
jgi:hypothetical protein